ncbi:MAG: hypothetical protein KGL58_05910, partial [Pseudomonadota bacterium]|nr:hypothetical protein [Pseudomonadota bacterium]
MKEHSAAVHAQVPVDVATFLLNEKRADIHSIESRLKVDIVLIPNTLLETPHYSVNRLRHDEIDDMEIKPSYRMVETPTEPSLVETTEMAHPIPMQAAVQGITPQGVAPGTTSRGIFSRISNWLQQLGAETDSGRSQSTPKDKHQTTSTTRAEHQAHDSHRNDNRRNSGQRSNRDNRTRSGQRHETSPASLDKPIERLNEKNQSATAAESTTPGQTRQGRPNNNRRNTNERGEGNQDPRRHRDPNKKFQQADRTEERNSRPTRDIRQNSSIQPVSQPNETAASSDNGPRQEPHAASNIEISTETQTVPANFIAPPIDASHQESLVEPAKESMDKIAQTEQAFPPAQKDEAPSRRNNTRRRRRPATEQDSTVKTTDTPPSAEQQAELELEQKPDTPTPSRRTREKKPAAKKAGPQPENKKEALPQKQAREANQTKTRKPVKPDLSTPIIPDLIQVETRSRPEATSATPQSSNKQAKSTSKRWTPTPLPLDEEGP